MKDLVKILGMIFGLMMLGYLLLLIGSWIAWWVLT
jgi:hypothetical protein